MKMKAIILLNLFIPIFSLISNTKPVIINLNHNDAEKTITKHFTRFARKTQL